MSKRTNNQAAQPRQAPVGGLDLRTLRGDKDVIAGFGPSVGIYRFTVKNGEGQEMQAEMPVLDINYTTADNKNGRISIPPDSTMALIAILSEFSMKLQPGQQQGAPPPAPPADGGHVQPPQGFVS